MIDKEKKIGALWVHEKNGKKYLSGKCQDVDIVVFKNGYKEEGTKQPDWIIFVSEKKGGGAEKPAPDDVF